MFVAVVKEVMFDIYIEMVLVLGGAWRDVYTLHPGVSGVTYKQYRQSKHVYINSQYDRDLIITAHLTLPHPDLSP